MTINDELELDCNGYIRFTKGIEGAVKMLPENDASEALCGIFKELTSKKAHIMADNFLKEKDSIDADGLFFEALYRLNMGNDIDGCKKASELLSDYLSQNPDSVMGKTLLQIIKEQLKV